MQKSFKPKSDKLSETPDLICKGQSCFRCGTYVDLCEAICTMCGTNCKQAPCAACRDICERCGKSKVRCESRVQSREKEAPEHDDEERQDEGIIGELLYNLYIMNLFSIKIEQFLKPNTVAFTL